MRKGADSMPTWGPYMDVLVGVSGLKNPKWICSRYQNLEIHKNTPKINDDPHEI